MCPRTQPAPRIVARPDAISDGLRFAALAGCLSWTFTTLVVAAKYPMTSIGGFVAIETAFTVAQFLLVGPLLALSSRGAKQLPLDATNLVR